MKKWPALLLAPALFLTAARAQENRYELLGRVLQPLTAMLSTEARGQARALQAELTLTEMTGVPPALVGGKLRVAIQYPDKCLVEGLLLAGGTDGAASITICREGQQVWVYPGSLGRMLIAQAGELPKKKKQSRIEDFGLPFPEKQLVFLPVLFEVADAGEESIGGESCRVLGLRLMPELARSLRAEEWTAEIAVRADHRLARLALARQGWRMNVDIARLEFSPTLPAETWKPSPEQSADLLQLGARECQQLLQALDRHCRGKAGKALRR